MSKSVDQKLSEALDIEYNEKEIQKTEPKAIKPYEPELNKDYRDVRDNLHHIIDSGQVAIDGILRVASEGESPRAYEVVSQLIKSVSEANKDLIDLHKKMKDINKEETTINNTTNNALYIGSTSELQDLINQSRSAKKALSNDIIDAEVVDDDG